MTIIPFPKPCEPSPKAVEDFKRVCDAEGLQLRDDDAEAKAAIAKIKAALGVEDAATPSKELPPPDEV